MGRARLAFGGLKSALLSVAKGYSASMCCRHLGGTYLAPIVAQSCTLLYRRVALCQPLGYGDARDQSRGLPTSSRRYGRLKICATKPAPAARKTDFFASRFCQRCGGNTLPKTGGTIRELASINAGSARGPPRDIARSNRGERSIRAFSGGGYFHRFERDSSGRVSTRVFCQERRRQGGGGGRG